MSRRADLDDLVELEDERDFLLRSLADLEREHAAGDLDEHDFLELRDGYTARAAAVLRGLEERTPTRVRPTSAQRRRSALVVVGVVAFAVVAGSVIARTNGTRLPGQTATGNDATSTAAFLAQARSLQATDPTTAVKRYIDVLKVEPDNVEALTYRGWIEVRLGLANNQPDFIASGRASLARALVVDQTYPDARVFAGVVAWQVDKDAVAAAKQFDAYFALGNSLGGFDALVIPVDAEVRKRLGLPDRFPAATTVAP